MHKIPDKYRIYFICLALAVTSLAVFWQVRNFDFVNYDDDKYVTEDNHISSGFTRHGIAWLFTGYIGRWHPLTGLTHMLDCQLFGLNAGWHHLTNLLLHLTNTLLLFALFKKATGALWQSAFVAALFAVHPFHVESVAWVSGRKDVLSTLFMILTICAYFRYVKNHSLGGYVLALALFALGLMAKPMLITLPFVLLLLDYWPLQRFQFKIPLRLVWEKAPFFALSIISTVLTFFIQKNIGAIQEVQTHPLIFRLSNAVVSYTRYIEKMIWPKHLAVFYPYPRNTIPTWIVVVLAVILLAITIRMIFIADKYKYMLVGWFWYLGTLVPVIGLVKLGAHAMADRYTYVALIGLFIIVAWGANDLLAGWKYRKTVLSLSSFAVITALAVCSSIQTGYWRNSITLFEHALKVTSENYLAHANLGAELIDRSELDHAIDQLHLAIQINPACAEAYCNLGDVYRKLGRYSDAIQTYNSLLRVRQGYPVAYFELGVTYNRLGQFQQAIEAYTSAVKIKPDYAAAYNNLGVACSNLDRLHEAQENYNKAIKIDPMFADAYDNLGVVLGKLSRYPQSIQAFSQAIQIKPDFAEAHLGLGVVYFMSGNKNSALKEYEILKTLDPQKAGLLLNLINK